MECLAFLAIILVLAQKAQSRFLTLSTGELVPHGIDHLGGESSFLSLNGSHSFPEMCVHQYGFLPCASNTAGFIFQIIVLEFLLLVGDKILTWGRQQLFRLFGVGIYGATVFRILTVLPRIVLVVASGLAQTKDKAQSVIETGVGSLAGNTIYCLTLLWGICVFLGRTKITEESASHGSPASTPKCFPAKEKFSSLTDSGIRTDKETCYTAGIMLLSLIPLVVVELADAFKSHACKQAVLLLTIIVSSAALVSHFIYQSQHEWIQERSLEYAKNELVLAEFLYHMYIRANRRLVNEKGELDELAVKRLFDEVDKNKDNCISHSELKALLEEMKSGQLGELDKDYAFKLLMKRFDHNDDHLISLEEFVDGFKTCFSEAKEKVDSGDAHSKKCFYGLRQVVQPWIEKRRGELAKIEKISEILDDVESPALASLLTDDGKPDEDKIGRVFNEFDKDGNRKMTSRELKEMIKSKFGYVKLDGDEFAAKMMEVFDKDADQELSKEEFRDGIKKCLAYSQKIDESVKKDKHSIYKKLSWDFTKAVLVVILGIAVVSSLGLPLIRNTQSLSQETGIPSFFVSFVVLPLAVNFRISLSAIFPASQKKERTSSLTFSEIYGEVVMNNIVGLLTLAIQIYARHFRWDYSAEVLLMMVISAIIGVFAYARKTYPLWTCSVAVSLYPLSLVLYYILRYLLHLR